VKLVPTENEENFEQQICSLANHEFGENTAQLFGRRGQKQYGIDIIVSLANGERIAIQCKQTTKDRVPENKLKQDYLRARSCGIEFSRFIFATTAPRDSALQKAALELEAKEKVNPKITIWSWSHLKEWAAHDELVREIFDPNFTHDKINREEYQKPSKRTQNILRRYLDDLLDSTLQSNYLKQRFNPALYVQREIEKDLDSWIQGKKKGFKHNTTYLIAPAGSGKTCLAASLADKFRTTHNVILLPAAFLRRSTALSIFEYAEHSFVEDIGLEEVRHGIHQIEILSRIGPTIIVIDGINEAHSPDWMKHELLAFAELQSRSNLHILITCRDYYWGAFEDRVFTETANIIGEYRHGGLQRKQLADFRFSEYQTAISKYSAYYDVKFKAESIAKEQFRHPLLLRFFCETYAGEKIGVVRNIRLKELFDTYTERKSDQLTRELQKHMGVGLHARQDVLRQKTMRLLEDIAAAMLNRNSRVVQSSEFLSQDLHLDSETHELLFHKIIDEYIILEELGQEIDKASEVSFVFEAYMEYCMASALHRSMLSLTIDEITNGIRNLTAKYNSFIQILGVVLFLSLFLKERRRIAIWPALFELGEIWQKVILEAFRKLPADQIDDGVFDAITDLLKSGNTTIQVETLELLKYGRLRRPLSSAVVNAIKPLLRHNDPKIFRRAIHVVGELPENQALRLFEYLLDRDGRRITDWYLIRDYVLKYISRIQSRKSFMLEMQIYGAEDFPCFARQDLNKRQLTWWLKALNSDHRPTRIGALKFAEQSTEGALITHLEEFIAKPDTFPKSREGMSIARSSNEFLFVSLRKPENESFEIGFARDALSKLKNQIRNDRNCKRVLDFIRSANVFPDPIRIKKICRRRLSFEGYFDVEIELIARGLEVRSGRRWNVGFIYNRSYGKSAIHISAPGRSLRARNVMSIDDWKELTQLLSSTRFNHQTPSATYSIPVYNRYSDYEDEYCYRAWGEAPKIIGYRREYYD